MYKEYDLKTLEKEYSPSSCVEDINVYINQYSNAQMGLNIVNWLAELDYQAFINTKEIKVERLDLTSKQKRQVVVILFLLPFCFVIIGLIVWLRKKSN